MSFSAHLVEQGVADPALIEQAIARQALWGADLITNLLELTAIDEAKAQRALAGSWGLEAGPVGALSPGAEVRELISPEIAIRNRLVPLERHPAGVVVAVAEPLAPTASAELERVLGGTLVQRIVILPRLLQALSRYYGWSLPAREAEALANLESGRVARHEETWSPHFSNIPRPPSEPPRLDSLWPIGAAGDAELFQVVADANPNIVLEAAPLSRRVPRRGPITAGNVQQELRTAPTRASIVSAFFDFASQFFEYSALLTIHDGVARGRDSRGPGAGRDVVLRIEVPIDGACALRKVQMSGLAEVIVLKDQGADRDLLEALQRSPRGGVFLLPVQVRGRTVLMLYGDERFGSVSLGDIGEVVAIAPFVGAAIERSIVRGKHPRRIEWTLPPPPPKAVKPSPEESAQKLAAMVDPAADGERTPNTRSSFPMAMPRIPAIPMPSVTSARVIDVGTPTYVPSVVPALRTPPFKSEPVFPLSRLSGPIASAVPEITLEPAHRVASPQAVSPQAARVAPRATEKVGESPEVESWTVPSEPPTARLAEDDVEAFMKERAERSPRTQRSSNPGARFEGKLPDRRSEHAIVDVPHAAMPPVPSSSSSLSVVVEGIETEELVDLACHGDEVAEAALSELGSAALPAVLRHFPGPVRPIVDEIPKSSECGPLLRIVRQASLDAVPGLVELSRLEGKEPGAWALVLLAEIGGVRAMSAIADAIANETLPSERFSVFLRHLMDLVRSAPEDCKVVGARLSAIASEPGQNERVRLAAIGALGELRVHGAVMTLVALVTGAGLVSSAAVAALHLLTRQDFGNDRAAWQAWAQKNASRHRIEWLIDALGHDHADVRRTASDELKSETKEYFGYYEDLPASERASAQRRYAHWWDTVGRARFR